MTHAHVLILEDEAPVARLLRSWVELDGASVRTTGSAEQALLLAAVQSPAIVVCDVCLPGGRDGFWFVERLRPLHPETVVVMSTGLQGIETVRSGLRTGVSDLLVKPFTYVVFREALRRAFAEHLLRRVSTASPEADAPDSRRVARDTTAALFAILHAQRGNGARHAEQVSHLSVKLAEALGVEESERSHIEHAALFCDVDRVDVYAIAKVVPYLASASEIAVARRECFDGTGFPVGLRGDAIPLGARIIAVASAYEDLVEGSGLHSLTPAEAIDTLVGERAREFDPNVLDALRLQLQPIERLSAAS